MLVRGRKFGLNDGGCTAVRGLLWVLWQTGWTTTRLRRVSLAWRREQASTRGPRLLGQERLLPGQERLLPDPGLGTRLGRPLVRLDAGLLGLAGVS